MGEGKWIAEGVETFGRYFRKKGWLGPDGELDCVVESAAVPGNGEAATRKSITKRAKWWGRSESGVRIIVE